MKLRQLSQVVPTSSVAGGAHLMLGLAANCFVSLAEDPVYRLAAPAAYAENLHLSCFGSQQGLPRFWKRSIFASRSSIFFWTVSSCLRVIILMQMSVCRSLHLIVNPKDMKDRL